MFYSQFLCLLVLANVCNLEPYATSLCESAVSTTAASYTLQHSTTGSAPGRHVLQIPLGTLSSYVHAPGSAACTYMSEISVQTKQVSLAQL